MVFNDILHEVVNFVDFVFVLGIDTNFRLMINLYNEYNPN